jgi:hypothetical protein
VIEAICVAVGIGFLSTSGALLISTEGVSGCSGADNSTVLGWQDEKHKIIVNRRMANDNDEGRITILSFHSDLDLRYPAIQIIHTQEGKDKMVITLS